MLQALECAELSRELTARDARYAIEIETNGTLVPPAELDAVVRQYTVSAKLENSGVERALRLRSEALEFFARSEKAVFKFVVGGAADVEQVSAIVSGHAIDPDRERELVAPWHPKPSEDVRRLVDPDRFRRRDNWHRPTHRGGAGFHGVAGRTRRGGGACSLSVDAPDAFC